MFGWTGGKERVDGKGEGAHLLLRHFNVIVPNFNSCSASTAVLQRFLQGHDLPSAAERNYNKILPLPYEDHSLSWFPGFVFSSFSCLVTFIWDSGSLSLSRISFEISPKQCMHCSIFTPLFCQWPKKYPFDCPSWMAVLCYSLLLVCSSHPEFSGTWDSFGSTGIWC